MSHDYNLYLDELKKHFKNHFKLMVHEGANNSIKHAIDWNSVKSLNKSRELKEFLQLHPNSPHSALCKKYIEDEENNKLWLKATSENTLESYTEFLTNSIDSRYQEIAERLIQSLTPQTFKKVLVPDIGDLGNVEVMNILVSIGQEVKEDDSLVALESEKATMEIPAPFDGVVKSIECSVGDSVSEGALILLLSDLSQEN